MRSIPAARPPRAKRLRPSAGPAWTGSLLAVLAASGCRIVDAKVWNLKELHDDGGRHRYSGALEGDFEYFLRHQVAGILSPASVNLAEKGPSAIPDPATECLENLLELADCDTRDPRVAGLQVEWFARLAVADSARLSRERAVLGLGTAGARLQAGVPIGLAQDDIPAGPEAVGEAISGLARAAGPILAGGPATPTQRADLDAACALAEELVLDLDGARRLLRVALELSAAARAGQGDSPLSRLALDLQRRCVRQALAAALVERDPFVRAAAVEASVRCAGAGVLEPILEQLDRESSPEVLVRVLRLVAESGLPEASPDVPAEKRAAARERQVAAIYGLIYRTDSEVRVAAMSALARVSGAGIGSLREEDWQSWWQARKGTPPL